MTGQEYRGGYKCGVGLKCGAEQGMSRYTLKTHALERLI